MSQTLLIAPLTELFLNSNRDVRAASLIGDSRPERDRIDTPFMNKDIWSRDDAFSVRSDFVELNKLDTAVQRSSTDERNTVSLRIEEGSLESICPKIVEKSNLSDRMNLANYVLVQTPKLVSCRHPPMQIDNVGNPIDSIAATRVMDQDGIWRPTDRDVRTAPTHGNIETISEKLTFRKYMKDSDFETREVFEQEMSNRDIENIATRLDKTQLDQKQMTQSMDS